MTTKAKVPHPAKSAGRPAPDLPAACDALLGKAQMLAALGISLRKFASMLSAGQFPRADLRVGDLPKWRVSTFNAWVAAEAARYRGGTKGG